MKNLPIIFAIVLVLVTGAAFYGGKKYQESKSPARNMNQQLNQFRQRNGNGNSGRAVAGDVLNTDGKSLTVKLPDGSSKIVLFSDKTTVSQATASATTDIKPGEKVMVFGTNNADGSVTAQNIQINPSRNF